MLRQRALHDQLDRLKTALADRYAIQEEVGAGGMATVYLAEDLKHHRQVALKVLRPELAAILGAERFLKEIEVTANLQHPNILPLYDSGEADTFLYYVMPYIEGESLRDKLNREKQLAVEETVEIAKSVSAALQFAHERNVVHRDIKPENILLQAGQALVADFGIALAVSQAGGTRLTETGLSLGTPHYMSPEQATGDRDVDARSDVYSLGCVCYEMLVGEPPHLGNSVQAIIAKILSDTPTPITRSRELVPSNVDAAVQRALAKTPADRFASAGEFAAALTNRSFTLPTTVAVDVAGASATKWNSLSKALATAAAVLLLTTLWGLLRNQPTAGPTVYDVALPDSAPMLTEGLPGFAVSSFGDFAVYTAVRDATTELWYRSLEDGTTRPIPGTEGAQFPMVSPDGERVAFFSTGGQMRIVSSRGGVANTVAETLNSGAHWMSDSRIIVVGGDGSIFRHIDPDGGELEAATLRYCILPYPLPNDDRLLCGGGDEKYAYVVSPGDSVQQLLRSSVAGQSESLGALLRGTHFRLVDGSYLTYMSIDGDLRATSVDLKTLRVGRSVTLVTGIRREAYTGAGQYDVTPSGTLVYVLGSNADVGRLVKFTGGETAEPLPVEPAAFMRYDLTPDGRRLAVVVEGLQAQELRIYDLTSGRSHQVWLTATSIGEVLWSADGDTLATVVDDPEGPPLILRGSVTASDPPDTLLAGIKLAPTQYTSDHVIFGVEWIPKLALTVDISAMTPVVDTVLEDVAFPSVSPDGRWFAYSSADLTLNYVAPHPSNDRRYLVTDDGGDQQWLSPSELVYWRFAEPGATFVRVRIDASQNPPVGEAIPWWTDPRWVDTPGQSFTITPDGGIVYVQGPEQKPATFLRVIPNWVEQMKRAVDDANDRR